jgi:hypothetical protein
MPVGCSTTSRVRGSTTEMFPALATTLAILAVEAPIGSAAFVVDKLSCLDRIEPGRASAGRLWLKRESVRWERIQDFSLFSDGYVVLYVQRPDVGLIDCRARIRPERLAQFKDEVARTKVWRLRPPTQSRGEHDSLYLSLDQSRRCQFQTTPQYWSRSSAMQALQEAIDRLRRDVCEGSCPEPKKAERLAPHSPAPDTLRIVPPADAAPSKKP